MGCSDGTLLGFFFLKILKIFLILFLFRVLLSSSDCTLLGFFVTDSISLGVLLSSFDVTLLRFFLLNFFLILFLSCLVFSLLHPEEETASY